MRARVGNTVAALDAVPRTARPGRAVRIDCATGPQGGVCGQNTVGCCWHREGESAHRYRLGNNFSVFVGTVEPREVMHGQRVIKHVKIILGEVGPQFVVVLL